MAIKSLIDKLPELILQVFLITIAVYLGLIANDWNQSIKDNEVKLQTKEMIIQEVGRNYDKIKDAFDYHTMLIDSISIYQKKRVTSLFDLKFWRGLRTPTLSESSYQTTMTTGTIALLSMNEIKYITESYTYQKRYENASILSLQTMLQFDYSNNPDNLNKIITKVLMLLRDLYWIEKEMIQTYTQTLNTINTDDKKPNK